MAFWLQANRRFKKIEGKHLALVISLNLFVAVIPLLIIIYAFAAAFSANHSFGALMARDLHLTGNSALVVRDTFTTPGERGVEHQRDIAAGHRPGHQRHGRSPTPGRSA